MHQVAFHFPRMVPCKPCFRTSASRLRQLAKSPGFSITAVISLALGIGATTAVFSVVYGILVNPYPYAAPDRMVHMRLQRSSNQEGGVGADRRHSGRRFGSRLSWKTPS